MRELYQPNENYGHATILRDYCGYKGPIPAVIPHGVEYEDDFVFPGEVSAPVDAVFSWPAFRDEPWSRYKRVIPGCAPFLYALKMAPKVEHKREGTAFFPMHSTHGVETDTDWYNLGRSMVELPQPVTVCLHWRDRDLRRDRDFRKRGCEVVNCGDLNDTQFHYRLIDLLSRVRYAASNHVGSNLFYSVAAGTPYFIFGERPSLLYRGVPGNAAYYLPSDSGKARADSVRELFTEMRDDITPAQKECADTYLGAERFRSPAGLLADLEAVA